MSTPLHTITLDTSVGIYENCEYTARVYAEKIIVVSPYVKWVGNSGGYAEKKEAIRDIDFVKKILADLEDECVDSAWKKIGSKINDDYLANQ